MKHWNIWLGTFLLLSVCWMLYCAYVAYENDIRDDKRMLQGVIGGLVILAMVMTAVFLIFFV